MTNLIPNVIALQDELLKATKDTIAMTLIAGSIALVVGLILALILLVTKIDGLSENKFVYCCIDIFTNVFRAIPFVILVVAIFPITRILMGSTIGFKGTIPSLVLGTIPFFTRQFEAALADVDEGKIEAGLAMGLSNFDIIIKIYLKEALPGIVRGTTITIISLIGLTTMVGAVAGGGIGDFALMYGLRRKMNDITYVTVIIILILVSIVQIIGNTILKIIDKEQKQ